MNRTLARAVAGIVAAAAVASVLAGCGVQKPSAQNTPISTKPVTISIDWWGSDDRAKRTQQVIDLFEKKHPNITVKPQFADFNGYWDKLATATAGKNAPDVIQMDEVYLASYAARGTLADLSKLGVSTKSVPGSVLDTGKVNGKQYAIPTSTAQTGLLVNADLVKRLGVPMPDSKNWTWDDYLAWSKKVTEASGGAVYGTTPPNNVFQLTLFARQNGDALFTGDKLSIKEKTLASYFKMLLDSTKDGASAPASAYAENAQLALPQQPFTLGKQATQWGSATLITAYQAAMKDNLEILPMPTIDDSKDKWEYFKAAMYWTVSSQSKHPVEAAALINFILTDKEAVKIIGTERGIPASTATVKLISPTLQPADKKAVAFSQSLLPTLGDAPAITPVGASDVQTTLGRYIQEVLFERQTPDQAAKAMIADVSSAIRSAK